MTLYFHIDARRDEKKCTANNFAQIYIQHEKQTNMWIKLRWNDWHIQVYTQNVIYRRLNFHNTKKCGSFLGSLHVFDVTFC